MTDNSETLHSFSNYLNSKDSPLYERVSPLNINSDNQVFSTASQGEHYTEDDWKEVIKHWQDYFGRQ